MRLFVAAWPPQEVLQEIEEMPRPPITGGRWTLAPQWHVTLRFLGEVASADPVVAALQEVDLPAAEAQLGKGLVRLGRGVLCVEVLGLGPLAGAVVAATSTIGRPPESRPFRGHITLARAANRAARLPRLDASFEPRSWPVRSVAVVRSILGRGPAQYETLANVPCQPSGDGVQSVGGEHEADHEDR